MIFQIDPYLRVPLLLIMIAHLLNVRETCSSQITTFFKTVEVLTYLMLVLTLLVVFMPQNSTLVLLSNLGMIIYIFTATAFIFKKRESCSTVPSETVVRGTEIAIRILCLLYLFYYVSGGFFAGYVNYLRTRKF